MRIFSLIVLEKNLSYNNNAAPVLSLVLEIFSSITVNLYTQKIPDCIDSKKYQVRWISKERSCMNIYCSLTWVLLIYFIVLF